MRIKLFQHFITYIELGKCMYGELFDFYTIIYILYIPFFSGTNIILNGAV